MLRLQAPFFTRAATSSDRKEGSYHKKESKDAPFTSFGKTFPAFQHYSRVLHWPAKAARPAQQSLDSVEKLLTIPSVHRQGHCVIPPSKPAQACGFSACNCCTLGMHSLLLSAQVKVISSTPQLLCRRSRRESWSRGHVKTVCLSPSCHLLFRPQLPQSLAK